MSPSIALRLLSLLLVALAPVEAEVSPSFSERLSEEEFSSAGLDKLSAEELSSLDELWRRYAADPQEPAAASPEVAVPQDPDLMGREQLSIDEKKMPKKIETRLIGTFDGWSGETTFELENGQVWQQRIDDRVNYTPADNPEVTIYRAFGGYRLRVDGYNQSCPVKRIK